MKITTECIPCLIKRIIFEAENSTDDPEIRKKVIKNTCRILSELYDPNLSSAYIATKAHKLAYETLQNDDPYKNLKKTANDVAKKIVPHVEELIKKSDDPLKTSMICSIIGNMMDFGIDGATSNPETLEDIFDETFSQGLGYEDYDELIKILDKSERIMFFTDNCGEIVFDKILIRELKKKFKNMNITVVVKGEPIISDATLDDAVDLKINDFADRILTTGSFFIGINYENIPSNLKDSLDKSDIIICKGMANYEAFSETNYRPICYLLRSKCRPISSSMNIPQNVNAIKLYK